MALLNDLVRIPDLKSWLGVSGDDDDLLLERLVSQTSRAMLSYLDRPSILPVVYTECLDGGNEAAILLREWPVTSVVSCTLNGVAIPPSLGIGGSIGTGYVLDVADLLPPGRMQRLSLRGWTFVRGVQNVSISYRAGYQITNEVGVVPLAAPYEVRVLAPHGSFTIDVGVQDATGSSLSRASSVPGAGQYACSDGVYGFSSGGAGAIMQLSYGYVPSDIARCCIEWAADQYQYRTRIGQDTKSLGGQESVSFIVKDMPDFVRTVLQPYRRVVTP